MRSYTIAAALALLFVEGAGSAAPPAVLTPTGPWNVEFADSMCLLSRPYEKDRTTNLIIKSSMIGTNLEIVVTRATTVIDDVRGGKPVLKIANGAPVADAYFTAYSTAKMRLLRVGAGNTIALANLRGTLSIDAEKESRHLFALPGIERALPILSQCLKQLRAAYKVSEAEMAAIVTPPSGDLLGLFSTEDYPKESMRNGQFGTVGALLWVDIDGRVSTCEVIETGAAAPLQEATCNIIKRRARYTPGKDAAGKPIRAPVFYRVRWHLPR